MRVDVERKKETQKTPVVKFNEASLVNSKKVEVKSSLKSRKRPIIEPSLSERFPEKGG